LETQVSEADLARLLALSGNEDVLDLGSGTGFYTDLIAALTTGTVYAVELQPEMIDHYRERGVPTNVSLLQGDITALPLTTAGAGLSPAPASGPTPDASAASGPVALAPASVDVACTIATWHEIDGRLDVPGVAKLLRPHGRLIVIDWRNDPESWESGPPKDIRFSKEQVAGALTSHFPRTHAEDLGRFMFAVTARR